MQGIAHPVQQFVGAKARGQPRSHRRFAEERRQRVQTYLDLAGQADQQLDLHPGAGQRAQVTAGVGRYRRQPGRQVGVQARQDPTTGCQALLNSSD